MATMTPLEWNRELLDILLRRLEPLDEAFATVLDSIMSLYQDHSRHKDTYKYGPQGATMAYMAVKNLMDAGASLEAFRANVGDARSSLNCVSGDLYHEQDMEEKSEK